jgi:cysteine desulfurase
VQAAAWMPLRELVSGAAGGAATVDALSISGHKLGAPKGIGALFVRGRVPLEPLIHGGGHERGRRSGTENVASIVGLAAGIRAVEAEQAASSARAIEGRDAFIHLVEAGAGNARLTGHRDRRLPGHASFTFPGLNGESLLIELESRGVLASSGSACAAGRSDPSHVLLALGLDAAEAQTAVRFTFDASVTDADLARAATALGESVLAVQGLGRG